MGVVHKPHPDWCSHIPILIKCLELTNTGMGAENPVLELGMGMFSTPLLHALCYDQNRLLVSLDNDGRFTEMFRNFAGPRHYIQLVEGWGNRTMVTIEPWTVALVDHKPAIQRKEDIKLLAKTDYVIVHDTQERADEFYGFEEIYPLFKYRYDYTKFANQTTVLSNKHDVYNQLHSTL